MEKFKIIAISVNHNYGNSFVIEGEDLYYYINEMTEKQGFDTIYPCPVGQVAGRFRHNWFMDNGEHDPVPENLVNRIQTQQKDPKFQKFCEQQKLQFGKKRFEFSNDEQTK
jgi:hypothetical protein